jgi:alpha-galactosidase
MAGSQWAKFAQDLIPAGWELDEALPFGFATGKGPVEWACRSSRLEGAGDRLSEGFVSADGALAITAIYSRHSDTRAFVVELFIANCTDQPSDPFTLIEPLRLSWKADGSKAYARTMAGGVNEKVYPPHAFRLDTLRLDPGAFHWTENGWDGRSSNKDLPLLVASASEGALVSSLEWSGYWWGSVARPDGSRFHVQIRIPVKGLCLGPKETLELPAAHYLFAPGGLDEASNAFRRYLNARILPPVSGKPLIPTVNYNHWFGLGPNISESLMLRQVQSARKTGAEYFVLDAGWYAGCAGNDFECGVGNLERVDPAKFPRGLRPLAESVRAAGMQFGLWFELERAHRSSDWVQRHPEWFIDIGSPYLHLDLSHKEAQDACIALMTGAVRDLGLRWIKLDYNVGPRPYWDHADPTGKIQFSYLKGLYRVLDETLKACPNVIMECCASGGRRIDLAMLRRAHEAWISDESVSSENVRFMQIGAGYFLPGQLNNECIPFGQSEGSSTFTDYDVACRMTGSLAFHGELSLLSSDDLDRLNRMADMFKTYRHLLREDFYPLLPQPSTDSQWEAVQYAAYDASESVILAFSGREELAEPRPQIRLKGLRINALYTVRRLGGATRQTMTGEELMREGLKINLSPRSFAAWHVAVSTVPDR